jgi:hypothetical protein
MKVTNTSAKEYVNWGPSPGKVITGLPIPTSCSVAVPAMATPTEQKCKQSENSSKLTSKPLEASLYSIMSSELDEDDHPERQIIGSISVAEADEGQDKRNNARFSFANSFIQVRSLSIFLYISSCREPGRRT